MSRNSGFTMLEVVMSLAILSMLVILLSNILNLTTKISNSFLDYSEYEYAMMHKKIFNFYNDSDKIELKNNEIRFYNIEEGREHVLVFRNSKIFKKTKNPDKNYASGFSLLLENIKSYQLNIENEKIIVINIVDRMGKKRTLKFRLLDNSKSKDEQRKEENYEDFYEK